MSWLFKMAWRDSRRNRSRLMLFISSIVLGIAALVAIYSFGDNLKRDIESQAKELAGADLILDTRKPLSPEMQKILDTLGDERASERSFASMLYFVQSGGSRLVQIRALEGAYPYYGSIETTPAEAASTFRNAQEALVDKTLMLQFNAKAGDSIKVGRLNFKIAGTLDKVPGQTGITSTVAPVVYIPLRYLQETGLTQIGSRIQYKFYFRYLDPGAVQSALTKIQPALDKEGLDAETIESTKENTGRAFGDVNRFLTLSGFIALLLGCIGVGSAIHVYIMEKLNSIATLRCLGVRAWQAFQIYLIQIFFIGLIGAIAGVLLGTAIQFLLPVMLKDFIPVEIHMQLSWPAIGQGLLVGVIIALLFAMPSLLSVRRISPLNALRLSVDTSAARRDPLVWLIYGLILLFVYVFAGMQMKSWMQAGIFTLSILIALVLLVALSILLRWLVRRLMPASAGYLLRQGFANLYRPNNQTLMLTVSIGLSTTLIGLLFLVQGMLMDKVSLSAGENQANMVLFDIQSDQKDSLAILTRGFGLPVMNEVPIVTVRIEEINGQRAADLAKTDSLKAEPGAAAGEPSQRAFRGELRITFQDTLTDAEKVVKGEWVGTVKDDGKVFVSLEENYARRIQVGVGDTILWNVQGMLLPTVVGSLRSVDWGRMQTNFRVVFPRGVLEEAPQFFVMMTRVPSGKVSADFQTAVVREFPNVSVIDLKLILQVLDELLSKIGFVIRFMAGLSMLTGWVVLISTILTSKSQRLRENALLRMLGANKRQIMVITALEYLFVSVLAAGAGLILALAGSYVMAVYSFDTAFRPPILPLAILFLGICLLVVLTGILGNRKVLSHTPVQVLNN